MKTACAIIMIYLTFAGVQLKTAPLLTTAIDPLAPLRAENAALKNNLTQCNSDINGFISQLQEQLKTKLMISRQAKSNLASADIQNALNDLSAFQSIVVSNTSTATRRPDWGAIFCCIFGPCCRLPDLETARVN